MALKLEFPLCIWDTKGSILHNGIQLYAASTRVFTGRYSGNSKLPLPLSLQDLEVGSVWWISTRVRLGTRMWRTEPALLWDPIDYHQHPHPPPSSNSYPTSMICQHDPCHIPSYLQGHTHSIINLTPIITYPTHCQPSWFPTILTYTKLTPQPPWPSSPPPEDPS